MTACSEGLRIDRADAELHFRKAVLYHKAGQPAEAESCWRRILTLKRLDQFCRGDEGIYGHVTLRNLAVLAQERGDRAEAERLWRMVLDACPGDVEAMSRGEASGVNQGGHPPTVGNPMPSASVRKVSEDTTGPARKIKRPWQDAQIPWSVPLEASTLPAPQPWPRQEEPRS